jgi:predicted enzyme related to lactoylglutathione lyase
MVKTRGLTHIHLVVENVHRSLDFYKCVFGMHEKFWAAPDLVFLNTPGSNDLIALHQGAEDVPRGSSGGILHFGFQLETSSDLDSAISQVVAAGGTLERRGEFVPGMPFAYIGDLDGYKIELWGQSV